jgi:hypothetical protein
MIFDAREVPDTKESVEAAKQEAQRIVHLWDKRALLGSDWYWAVILPAEVQYR